MATARKTSKKTAKKQISLKAIKPARKSKTMVIEEPTTLETDDDLRTILNKSDFDRYELDAYLNDN